MPVPGSSVLNLTNIQMILEIKAIELAKFPPTTATTCGYNLLPHKPNSCAALARVSLGIAMMDGMAQAALMVEGAGAVVEKLDRTATIIAVQGHHNSHSNGYPFPRGGGSGSRIESLPTMMARQ